MTTLFQVWSFSVSRTFFIIFMISNIYPLFTCHNDLYITTILTSSAY